MSRVVNNTFWLMLSQIGGLVIPLIELPILTRTLGLQGYGQILYAIGIALTASIFIEFGFNFSAARELVKIKNQRQKIAQLVTNVLVAKLFLSCIITPIVALLIYSGIGETKIPAHWFLWVSLFMFAFGFSPIWYYIGIEKLIFPAVLDFVLRSMGLLLIIFLVTRPQYAHRVLIIQAFVGITNTLIPTLFMIKRTGLKRISLLGTKQILCESWALFLYKGTQSIMGSIASTLLGLFSGAQSVGAFVPAEKLTRAATGLAMPMLNATFPYVVNLQLASTQAAKKVINLLIIFLAVLTVIFSIFTVWLSPWVVKFIFGHGNEHVSTLLKILVWIVPLRVINMAMAVLWFIPIGKENIASKAMMINFILICILAFLLVPVFGALGMTVTLLSAEIVMFSILITRFLKK